MTEIKIVPDATPNADGTWITVNIGLPTTTRWAVAEMILAPYVPKGSHMVAYRGK